ncbi:hypothetical protein PPYR_04253 [Photinus pyralis]|uniref:Major facilitator superfamily (MFS) profile domain-containing protein n=1 Tax=Photinus pyralis TaxID=7054 RepID=A0A1Y1NEK4_PHOPY|nr:sialin-like [Photinus pyralis]KAB0802067.1 hypothetical protein PPYR_04253 [Photinus pyralis]
MGCLNCTFGNVVIPQRYVACVMAFLAIVNSYTMRGCLNLAITEIVQGKGKAAPVSECNVTSAPIVNKNEEKYEWAPEQIATVLTAFYYGYVPSHVPGGFLSDVYGAKFVLMVDVIVSIFVTLLTPMTIVMGSWKFLCLLRALMGLVQGPLFPATATLLAKWVPKSERARAGTWVFTGAQVGSIFGYLVSGFIMGYMNSWKAVFYFWGIISIVWVVAAQFLLYSEPATHPRITQEENEMLVREIGIPERLSVPWLAMLTDSAAIACISGWCGHAIKFYYINTNLPLYIKDVLKFNVIENGVFNAIAYAALWIFASVAAVVCDMTINRNWMSVMVSRRVFAFIGNVFPATALMVTGFVGCHRNWAIVTIILSTALQAPVYCSIRVNVLDLTKNYAGILTAFVNGIGALAYWPVPYLIAGIAGDNKIRSWCILFEIMFGVSCFFTLIYLIWVRGERRDWDKIE